ncbi:hypothetical protein SYJ56_06080 [Algoriphagus sp. D3-2-R+10]|uniref:hypothetical protein n=1 Tax=Algoriphagus aurantiacus TaxID=3103948 RepID=UPI002B381B1D|nr:hypothetical protein [Algoriphagus sp. D3-2-R+10]MEB2774866.1 hypothetical protein [Algoriphagus sp. D3-2-R+10]
MKNLVIIYLICMPLFTKAQNFETNIEAQKEIQKIEFLVGEWEGSGWMMNQSREKMTFEQTEKVSFKINDTALLIEGQGVSDGKIIHSALAVLTMVDSSGKYKFTSFLQSNQQGTFKAELIDDVLYWYPAENVRYVITINDQGQWHEIGEANSGGTWYQFFEMTLNKK